MDLTDWRPEARVPAWLGACGFALAAAALTLSGCAETGKGGGFGGPAALPPTSGSEVTVSAGGRDIRVAPPTGFCVDPSNVQPQGRSTFVLIEDCALFAAGPGESGNAAPNLPIPRPALVNGIVTLSIGAGPLLGDGQDADAAFDALAAFLRSEDGRATAGMGGDASAIRILDERRVDDTLYLLIEDRGERVLPVLGERFWRGFTDVRERAVIASLGVFDASRMGDAQKLAHLAAVVAALKDGNGQPVLAAERRLASGAPTPRAVAAAPPAQAPAAPEAPAPGLPQAPDAADAGTQVATLFPARRPTSNAPAPAPAAAVAAAAPPRARAAASLGDDGTPLAPRNAPAAPRRPRA